MHQCSFSFSSWSTSSRPSTVAHLKDVVSLFLPKVSHIYLFLGNSLKRYSPRLFYEVQVLEVWTSIIQSFLSYHWFLWWSESFESFIYQIVNKAKASARSPSTLHPPKSVGKKKKLDLSKCVFNSIAIVPTTVYHEKSTTTHHLSGTAFLLLHHTHHSGLDLAWTQD